MCEDPPTTGVEGAIRLLLNLSTWKSMEMPLGVAPGSTPDPTLNDEPVSKRSVMPNLNGPVLEGIE